MFFIIACLGLAIGLTVYLSVALSALTGQVNHQLSANAGNTVTGFTSTVPMSLQSVSPITALGTTTAGAANLGSVTKHTIAASGSLSIDMTARVDPAGTWNYARIKALSIVHDAASAATGSGGVKYDLSAANSGFWWFGGAGDATTFVDLLPGEALTVGGLTANGFVVDGTHKVIKITNLDAVNAATVYVGTIGADA